LTTSWERENRTSRDGNIAASVAKAFAYTAAIRLQCSFSETIQVKTIRRGAWNAEIKIALVYTPIPYLHLCTATLKSNGQFTHDADATALNPNLELSHIVGVNWRLDMDLHE